MDLKELVKDQTVIFEFYKDGNLWYKIKGGEFTFPVPLDDVGNATFMREDKAILFMRYIRKHMQTQQEARS